MGGGRRSIILMGHEEGCYEELTKRTVHIRREEVSLAGMNCVVLPHTEPKYRLRESGIMQRSTDHCTGEKEGEGGDNLAPYLHPS